MNGHQIDVLRRTVKRLNEESGECLLVKLASALIRTGTRGFGMNDWCGYGKLRPMIGAYPQFFTVYLKNGDPTVPCVKVVESSSTEADGHAAGSSEAVEEPFDADRFLKERLDVGTCMEIMDRVGLTGSLRIPEVLQSFLYYTFLKLKRENKIVMVGDGLMVWHSGLYYQDVDACLFYIAKSEIDGRYNFGITPRDSLAGRSIVNRIGHVEPAPPSYGREQFDTSLRVCAEAGHILVDNNDRIPSGLIGMVRHANGEPEDVADLVIVSRYKGFFRRILDGAITEATKRIGNGLITPVPFWYPRYDKTCWLIPLRMGFGDDENVALVLELIKSANGEQFYKAPTILPLKEAFIDARLLGEVNCGWLDPNVIFGEDP